MAKKQRAEDMLTDEQREKIYDLYLAGYRVEMIGQRFGATVDQVKDTLTLVRKERRRIETALTDWGAEFSALRRSK